MILFDKLIKIQKKKRNIEDEFRIMTVQQPTKLKSFKIIDKFNVKYELMCHTLNDHVFLRLVAVHRYK